MPRHEAFSDAADSRCPTTPLQSAGTDCVIGANRSSRLRDPAVTALQVAFLCAISWVGHRGVALAHLPVPGNVAGLIILFLFLCTGLLPLQSIERGADLLIRHLGLFFLPIAVGFLALGNLAAGHRMAIALALVGSTAVGFTVTASIAEQIAWLLAIKTKVQT